MTDEELCGRLRSMLPASGFAPTENWAPWLGADRIEQLGREKAVVSELWEQQKEIALGYLADCNALGAENERLREELAAAYVDQSGTNQHASDCATSNAPAMKPGPCDCAALGEKQ